MSGIENYAKNAALLSGGIIPARTNSPNEYAQRQKQYYDTETRRFVRQRARYASDFVAVQVQGLLTGDKSEWNEWRIRFADVVRPTSAIQRDFDDYKQYLFESDRVEYVAPGTKMVTMGSTWLVINPNNISGASGTGIVRRCNAVWNHLDYYGNVISEPIIVENFRANANDSDVQQSIYITKGYFNVTCQYNEDTAQIDTNTRMILGSAAYRVTGFSDFEQEFTGDYNAVRLLRFTVRYEENVSPIDDMVNHVASGKSFSWDVHIAAPEVMRQGTTAQFVASSIRNGETVPTNGDYPVTYLWSSSDENVLTVDENGIVTAVGAGYAQITATLSENETLTATVGANVMETADGVFFLTSIPDAIGYGESVTIEAAYFDDSEETANALTWTFERADETSYSYTVGADGKSATVKCFGYSQQPLVVTASYSTYQMQAKIRMEGI